jgi:hypothetical protein
MNTITSAQLAAMKAAMDAAAAQFWAYPDQTWQANFQADWLEKHFCADRAVSDDGLVWGRIED